MAIDATTTRTTTPSALSRFKKIVLRWDYVRLLIESKKKDRSGLDLKRVKSSYKSFEEYIGVFEPLLFEEVKAQIVQQSNEEEESGWDKGGIAKCIESDGFHKVDLVVRDVFQEEVSENDLLILSEKEICSLSTIMRDYVALHSVTSLPFKDLILPASEKLNCISSDDRQWNVPRPLMDHLKDSLNDSQLNAIRVGLSRQSFVLVQGPPGTGKTQTILGLRSAVLHSSPARVQSRTTNGLSPRDLITPSDEDDEFLSIRNELKPEVVNSNRKHRVHVLVCAPSNSALDEIVLRLLHTGIHDENDHAYNPKIVRIGLKPHHSVKAASLDYLVGQVVYDDFLENGEMVERQTKRDWHAYSCFGPFSFLDIDGVESQPPGSGSWVNEDEVEFILVMYHKLASQYPELKSGSRLAVISPYRHQVKDVAIFSCVRANTGKGIGFVSDFRRMNVGITRAKSSVVVVGSASTLMQDEHWSNLVNSAKDGGCYFKVEKPHTSFFSHSNLESLRVNPKVKLEEKLQQMEIDLAQAEAANDAEDDHNEADGMDVDGGGGDDE